MYASAFSVRSLPRRVHTAEGVADVLHVADCHDGIQPEVRIRLRRRPGGDGSAFEDLSFARTAAGQPVRRLDDPTVTPNVRQELLHEGLEPCAVLDDQPGARYRGDVLRRRLVAVRVDPGGNEGLHDQAVTGNLPGEIGEKVLDRDHGWRGPRRPGGRGPRAGRPRASCGEQNHEQGRTAENEHLHFFYIGAPSRPGCNPAAVAGRSPRPRGMFHPDAHTPSACRHCHRLRPGRAGRRAGGVFERHRSDDQRRHRPCFRWSLSARP